MDYEAIRTRWASEGVGRGMERRNLDRDILAQRHPAVGTTAARNCFPSLRFKRPLEHRFFGVIERGDNIFGDFVYELRAPKWVRSVIVDDPNML